jgi:hypothetical protein
MEKGTRVIEESNQHDVQVLYAPSGQSADSIVHFTQGITPAIGRNQENLTKLCRRVPGVGR